MSPVCRAGMEGGHCELPERTIGGGLGAAALGGESTVRAKESKIAVNLPQEVITDLFMTNSQTSVPPKHAGSCLYCLPDLAGWR